MNKTGLMRSALAVAAIAGLAWAAPGMAQTQKDQPSWKPSATDKPGSSMPSTSGQTGSGSSSMSDRAGRGALAGDVKDVQGQIERVQGNTITLADGTELQLPDSIQVQREELKEGASVKASYEERGGQKVVTSIQVDSSTSPSMSPSSPSSPSSGGSMSPSSPSSPSSGGSMSPSSPSSGTPSSPSTR